MTSNIFINLDEFHTAVARVVVILDVRYRIMKDSCLIISTSMDPMSIGV